MISNKKSILIFGGDELQLSIIEKCINLGLYTVIIDPNPHAKGKDLAQAFEVVDGLDFESTCEVIEKYKIDAIITAATDKPLVMMARIAEKYKFPFFSIETAEISTDKYLMKTQFEKNNISCAKTYLSDDINGNLEFPIIVKPRDNSGSRGVYYCENEEEKRKAIMEASTFTKKTNILIEEFIPGKEYSVESLHFNGEYKVIQYTEKITSDFPYNVEMGHIQPAQLSDIEKEEISQMIENISDALGFENCVAHTEIKINKKGIFVIETSPRLGGDFITSVLTPISTGFDIENALISIAIGESFDYKIEDKIFCGIFYFHFKEGVVEEINISEKLIDGFDLVKYSLNIKAGSEVKKIKNSLDRYGYFILKTEDREKLIELKDKILDNIKIEIE